MGQIGYDALTKKRSSDKIVRNIISTVMNNTAPIDGTSFFDKDDHLTLRPVVPTVMVPMYDIWTNTDFAGRSIYREPFTKDLENKMARSSQFIKGTNPLLQKFTDENYKLWGGNLNTRLNFKVQDNRIKKFNIFQDINPSIVEHLITSYTGGRGQFWTDVISTSAKMIDEGNKVLTEDKKMIDAAKEFNANSLPVLSKFIRQPYKSQYETQYSEIRNEVSNFKTAISSSRSARDREEYKNLRDQDILMHKLRVIEHTENKLDAIYQQFMDPRRKSKLTQEAIDKLYDEADEIKKQAVIEIEAYEKGNRN